MKTVTVKQPQLKHPPDLHDLVRIGGRWAVCWGPKTINGKAEFIFLDTVNQSAAIQPTKTIDYNRYAGVRWAYTKDVSKTHQLHKESSTANPEKPRVGNVVSLMKPEEVYALDKIRLLVDKNRSFGRYDFVVWGEMKTPRRRSSK